MATGAIPGSRHARIIRSAISPRFAIRTFLNTDASDRRWLGRLYPEQRLSELHRLTVLRQDFGDLSTDLCLDFVHQLHRLDDAEDLPLAHHRAHLNEGRLIRSRGSVEGPNERRGHHLAWLVLLSRNRAQGLLWSGRRF